MLCAEIDSSGKKSLTIEKGDKLLGKINVQRKEHKVQYRFRLTGLPSAQSVKLIETKTDVPRDVEFNALCQSAREIANTKRINSNSAFGKRIQRILSNIE